MKKVFRQLINEFWLPLIGSILWVVYNSPSHIRDGIAQFGSAFFLLSYFTSQFHRVKKQAATEASFSSIKNDIERLIDDLKRRTHDLQGYINGGDSFCRIEVIHPTASTNALVLFHMGTHPLYEVDVRLADTQAIMRNMEREISNPAREPATYQFDRIPMLFPHQQAIVTPIVMLPNPTGEYNYAIELSARNGRFTQFVRTKNVNGKMVKAEQLSNAEGVTLWQNIDESFPMNENGSPDFFD